MGAAESYTNLELFEYKIPKPEYKSPSQISNIVDIETIKQLRIYYPYEIDDNFTFDMIDLTIFQQTITQRNENGQNTDDTYYYGQYQQQHISGVGIVKHVFPSEHNNIKYKFGSFQQSQLNGIGLIIYDDNSYYYGEFSNGIIQGIGFFIDSNQDIYCGNWVNEQIQTGYYKTSNLEYYGQFYEGKFHGLGRCYYYDGSCVEGEWQNDQLNGFIIHEFSNGDFYVGYSVNSLKQGDGFFNQSKLNRMYIGQFDLDKYHGIGSLIEINDNFYKSINGQFQFGKQVRIHNTIEIPINQQMNQNPIIQWFWAKDIQYQQNGLNYENRKLVGIKENPNIQTTLHGNDTNELKNSIIQRRNQIQGQIITIKNQIDDYLRIKDQQEKSLNKLTELIKLQNWYLRIHPQKPEELNYNNY